MASRDFLSVFTDAANHIPRHRRIRLVLHFVLIFDSLESSFASFFAHFVDTLGAKEYLASVCMLLIDKVSNRIVRQSAIDVQNSLAVALSLIQHYPQGLQIEVPVFLYNLEQPD